MRLSRGSKWFLAFSLLLVAAGAAGVWWLDTTVFDDDFEAGEPVEYEVGRGQTVRSVGEDLAELGVIRSAVRFRLAAEEEELATGLQPGHFEFVTGMSIDEAIAVLASGPLTPPQIRFTVQEGLTVEQTFERLADQFEAYDVDDFRQVLDDRIDAGANRPGALQIPGWIPEPAEVAANGDSAIEPFEGVLFPETYIVTDDATPLQILQRMVDQLGHTLDDIPQVVGDPGAVQEPGDDADAAQIDDDADATDDAAGEGTDDTDDAQDGDSDGAEDDTADGLQLTFYERLILASLIERETRVDAEREVIAGVITNRLAQGMRLQIDATVVYAMGGGPTQVVLLDDLEIDHPHNTYQIDGLPPTPIAAAGAASLQAAFAPGSVDSLFYVLSDACDGSHVFADTGEEHEANVAAFREADRCQG